MGKPVNDFYDFGEFRLDPVRRVLLRDGKTVTLASKVFETLLVLVEGRDRVMEKDELMRLVWPDAIVEEVALAKKISALRKALGERLGEHRYIVTVPGRGYRFVADVTEAPTTTPAPELADASAVVSESEPPAALSSPRASRRVRVRHPGVVVAFGLAVAALLVSAFLADARRRPTAGLTEKDTILLAGFTNKTGEPIFDDTLRQGLAAQLEQSPFLNLFPDDRTRQTLQLLGHEPDAPLTKDIARELCRRQGLKAFVTGAIAPLGQHYAITLEADDQNGRVLAREEAEADGKEQVLRALTQAAGRLRERLGESIGSIEGLRFELTTSSLEALQAHAEGVRLGGRGNWRNAIPLYQRAVALDPNFAAAHLALGLSYSNTRQRGLAAEALRKAYALRDRVSEYERARITEVYHLMVTGDLEQAIDALEQHREAYPRDNRTYTSLSLAYMRIGQAEKAGDAARESIRLNPGGASHYVNLAVSLSRLGRFDESTEVVTRAIEQLKLEADGLHRVRLLLALVRNDAEAVRRETEVISGKPYAHMALAVQSSAAAFAGQLRQSEALSRRAVALAGDRASQGVAAQYAAEAAVRAATVGDYGRAGAWATESLALGRDQQSQPRAALALALCGDDTGVHASIDELSKAYPEDTVVQAIWLPIVRAARESRRGDATAVIDMLQPVARFQAAAEFWPQYLRGQAYLRLRRGNEAAEEFRAILAARGQSALSMLYPLAQLGLAHATAMSGDVATAGQAYRDFFTLWKAVDSDLLPLIEAKADERKMLALGKT